MSSLARQLLSIAQSKGKDSSHLSRHSSLIFSQSESKELELPVVLTMAQAGYRELRSTDEALFSPFAETLFGASWAGLERELKPREVGDEVDAQVSAFALAVSPFLQLRATHACLEWLLRRFRVHVYNVDAMMEMALPHCDTAIFGRLLQILSIGANPLPSSNGANSSTPPMYSSQPGSQSIPLWHFLHPLAHSGAVLPRSVLSQQAIKDTGVLEFLCNAAKKAANAAALGKCRPRTILTFFALVSAEVLSISARGAHGGALFEKSVGALVPSILLGLRDEVVRDHQISSFIIAAALLGRDGSAVSEACFSSIVTASCLHLDTEHPQHVLSFLSAAFSGQALHHGYKPLAALATGKDLSSSSSSSSSSLFIERFMLTKKSLLALLRSKDFTLRVTALTDTHDASVFLRCLLQSCVNCLSGSCASDERVILLDGLSSLITCDASSALAPLIPYLTAFILDRFEHMTSSSSSSSLSSSTSSLASVLKLLGQVYGEKVDDGLRIVQSTASMSVTPAIGWAASVLSESSGLSYLPLSNSSSSSSSSSSSYSSSSSSSSSLVSLRLALFHSSSSVRLSALQHVRSEASKIISSQLQNSASSSSSSSATLYNDPRWSILSQALSTGLADTDAAVVSLSISTHADFIKSNLYCAQQSLQSTAIETEQKLLPSGYHQKQVSMNAAEIVLDSLIQTSQRWYLRGCTSINEENGGGGVEVEGGQLRESIETFKIAAEALLLASSVVVISEKFSQNNDEQQHLSSSSSSSSSSLSLSSSLVESFSSYLFSLLPIGVDTNVMSIAASMQSIATSSTITTNNLILPSSAFSAASTAESAINHVRSAAFWVASTVTRNGRPLHSLFSHKVANVDGNSGSGSSSGGGAGGNVGALLKSPTVPPKRKSSLTSPSTISTPSSSPLASTPSWITPLSLITSISSSQQAFDLIFSIASSHHTQGDDKEAEGSRKYSSLLSQRAKWHAIALIDAALTRVTKTSSFSLEAIDVKRLLVESTVLAVSTWSQNNEVIATLASALKSTDFSMYPETFLVKSICSKSLTQSESSTESSSSSSSSSVYSISALFDGGLSEKSDYEVKKGGGSNNTAMLLSLAQSANSGDQLSKSKLLNLLRILRARQEVCLDLLIRIVSALSAVSSASSSATDSLRVQEKTREDKKTPPHLLTLLRSIGFSIACAFFETPNTAVSWSNLSSILSSRLLVVFARSTLYSASINGESVDDFSSSVTTSDHQQEQLRQQSKGDKLLLNLLSFLTTLVSNSSALHHQATPLSSFLLSTFNSIGNNGSKKINTRSLSSNGATRVLEIIRSLISSSSSSSSSLTSSSSGKKNVSSIDLNTLLSCFRPIAFACLCANEEDGRQTASAPLFKHQAALVLKALSSSTISSASVDTSTALLFFGNLVNSSNTPSSSSSNTTSQVITSSFDTALKLINTLANDVSRLSAAVSSTLDAATRGGRGGGEGEGERLILDNSSGPASPSIFIAFAILCMQQFPLVSLQLVQLTVKICKRNKANREEDGDMNDDDDDDDNDDKKKKSKSQSKPAAAATTTNQQSRESHLKVVGDLALSILRINATYETTTSNYSLDICLAAVDLIAEVYSIDREDDTDEEDIEDEDDDEIEADKKGKVQGRVLLNQSIAISIVAEIVAILRSFSRPPPSSSSSLSSALSSSFSSLSSSTHHRKQSILIKKILGKLLTSTLWSHLIVNTQSVTGPTGKASSGTSTNTTNSAAAEKLGHELFDLLLSLVRRGRTVSSSTSSSSSSSSSGQPISSIEDEHIHDEYSIELSIAARTSSSRLRPLSTKFLSLSMRRNGLSVSLADSTLATSSASASSPMNVSTSYVSPRGVWSSEELAMRKETALTDIVAKIMNHSSSTTKATNVLGAGEILSSSRSDTLNACVHWLAKLSSWIEIALPDNIEEASINHNLLLQHQHRLQNSSSTTSSSSSLIISDSSSARTLHKSMFSSLEILLRLGETMMSKLKKKKNKEMRYRGGGSSSSKKGKGIDNRDNDEDYDDNDEDNDEDDDDSNNIDDDDEDNVIEASDLRGNIDFSLSLLLSKLRSLFQAIISSPLFDSSNPLYTAHEADLLLKIVQNEASSTHTRSAALMLLSAVASVQPEGILRRLVWGLTSGLTSIGSGHISSSSSSSASAASSRDDPKALSIVYRLIDAVVPPLSLHGPKHGVSHMSVIRVITSMLPRISLHRQRSILVAFIKKLAESKSDSVASMLSSATKEEGDSEEDLYSSSAGGILSRHRSIINDSRTNIISGEFVAAAVSLILSQLRKSASQHLFLYDAVVAASASTSSSNYSHHNGSNRIIKDNKDMGGKRLLHQQAGDGDDVEYSHDPLFFSIMKGATDHSSPLILPSSNIDILNDRSSSTSLSVSQTAAAAAAATTMTPLQVNPQLFDLSSHLLSCFSGSAQMGAIKEILHITVRKLSAAVSTANSSSSSSLLSSAQATTSQISSYSSLSSQSGQNVNELDVYVSDEDDFGGGSSLEGVGGMLLFSSSAREDEEEDDYNNDEDDETARKHKRLAFVLNAVSFAASVSQSQAFAESFTSAYRLEKEREEEEEEGGGEEEKDEDEDGKMDVDVVDKSSSQDEVKKAIRLHTSLSVNATQLVMTIVRCCDILASPSSATSSSLSSSSSSSLTITSTASLLLSSSREQQRLSPLFSAISSAARVILASLVQLSSTHLLMSTLNASLSRASSIKTITSWEQRHLRQQAQSLLLSRDVFVNRLKLVLSLSQLKGRTLKQAQATVARDVNIEGEQSVQMLSPILTLAKQSLVSLSASFSSVEEGASSGGGQVNKGKLIGKPLSKKKQPQTTSTESATTSLTPTTPLSSSSSSSLKSIPIFEMKNELEEHALIGRLSLDVFTLITRLYGEHFPATLKGKVPEILSIAESAAGKVQTHAADASLFIDILAKAITALATLTSTCSIAMLPFLPKIFTLALQVAESVPKNSHLTQSQIESFLISIVASIQTISVSLPTFLSSFLPRIFSLLMSRSTTPSSGFNTSTSVYYNLADYISVNVEGEPLLLKSTPYSSIVKSKQPYKEDLALSLTSLTSSSTSSAIGNTFALALETILDKVPTRNSFPNLTSMLAGLLSSANAAISSSPSTSSTSTIGLSSPLVLLVRAVTRVVCRMSKMEASDNLQSITSFFIQAADNRWKGCCRTTSDNNSSINSNASAHILASSIVEVELSSLLACLSLKLSDKQLRTLLLRLISWAFESVSDIIRSNLDGNLLLSHALSSSLSSSSYGYATFASFSRRIVFFRAMDDILSVAKEVFVPYAVLCISEATRELLKSASFAKSNMLHSNKSSATGGGSSSLIEGGFGALAQRKSKDASTHSKDLLTSDEKKKSSSFSSIKKDNNEKSSKSKLSISKKKGDTGSAEKKRRVRFGDEEEEDEEEDDEEEEEEEEDDDSDEDQDINGGDDKDKEEVEKLAELEKKNSLPGDLNFTSLLSFLSKVDKNPSESISSSSSSSSLSSQVQIEGLLNVSTFHSSPLYVTDDAAGSSMKVIASVDHDNDSFDASSSSSTHHARYLSRVHLPTSAHALRCTVLSFLRRSLALDASSGGDASNPLSFMASGGRQRLDQVLSPILSLYTVPLIPANIDKSANSITSMQVDGGSSSKMSKKRNREAATSLVDHSSSSSSSSSPSLQFLGVPGAREGYDSFVSTYLTPIISSLCMAVKSNDSNWKPIAQGLLMLTRDRQVHVRHAALSAVCEIFNRGGTDALVLLPETLPFLSELQSDTDSVVERICHELLHKLEVASGEDLSQYI